MAGQKKQHVKFTETSSMRAYNDVPKFHDGDIHEITSKQAEYLTETFPENFKKCEKPKPEPKLEPDKPEHSDDKKPEPDKDKSDQGPDANKSDSGPTETK